jgi:DNA-binding Lrp family transcriptional regulator
MEHEWSEIDGEVLSVLERRGESSPETIARELGISVGEVTAFICMLAREGRLRIQLVEIIRAERQVSRRAAASSPARARIASRRFAPSP